MPSRQSAAAILNDITTLRWGNCQANQGFWQTNCPKFAICSQKTWLASISRTLGHNPGKNQVAIDRGPANRPKCSSPRNRFDPKSGHRPPGMLTSDDPRSYVTFDLIDQIRIKKTSQNPRTTFDSNWCQTRWKVSRHKAPSAVGSGIISPKASSRSSLQA